MIITVDILHQIGDTVYLYTDNDQLARMVIAYYVDRKDVLYEVICGTSISRHYEFELSPEKSHVGI